MRYVYPDASIVCGPPVFDPEDKDQMSILNPTVVFEVLSETTEQYDRGRKFNDYRQIESLKAYVLISQSEPAVEVFARQADGSWSFAAARGTEAVAPLPSVGIELPLQELYDDVAPGD